MRRSWDSSLASGATETSASEVSGGDAAMAAVPDGCRMMTTIRTTTRMASLTRILAIILVRVFD
ncbi:MAG: hypothetical protein WAM53_09500, partial [Terrimicrobiaceae bacterium]